MSLNAYSKGKNFEQKVASLLRSKLKIAVQRDRRSGAGYNKSDISDYWNQLPLHLEIKDQETIKIKEFFRQADQAASFSKAPTVVFSADSEILACLRFSDLLNFLIEITDLKAENDDLRSPLVNRTLQEKPVISKLDFTSDKIKPVIEKKIQRGSYTCRAGHLSDEWGYCMQLDCKFSRGYKAKKKSGGKK